MAKDRLRSAYYGVNAAAIPSLDRSSTIWFSFGLLCLTGVVRTSASQPTSCVYLCGGCELSQLVRVVTAAEVSRTSLPPSFAMKCVRLLSDYGC